MTIEGEITKLNTNLTNSYTACNNKGATMPANQNFDNLATCIGSIQGGGGSSGWQPDPDWWDIKSILQADTRDYAGKAIILYSNSDNFTDITIASPLVAVATSDGAFYTSTTTHTWDRSKDKIVSSDTNDTTPKYGTRYLILYYDTVNVDNNNINTFFRYKKGSLYIVFGCNLTKTSTTAVTGISFLHTNYSLQSFDFLDGYNLNFGTSFSNFCYQCYSLTKLPDNLNVSSGTSFSNFCYQCYSLTKLPDNFNVSSGTSFGAFCNQCYSLVKANIKLAGVSVTLSSSTVIDIQSLEYIANNAPTVTGTVTLTIGSTNITRAGGASGTIISTLTNKGWTVN